MKHNLLKKITFIALLVASFGLKTNAQSAIEFSGNSGNQATASYSFDLNNGFTVEYETYIDNLNAVSGYNGGVTATNGNIANPLDIYIDGGGTMNVFLGNGSGYASTSVGGFKAGQWYNIAISYDPIAETGSVYVNGSLKGTMTNILNTNLSNQGTITIGNRSDNATYANSRFSNVMIWSGARTAAQIVSDEYTCRIGIEPGLQVLYNMTEGTGTTLDNLGSAGTTSNAAITGPFNWVGGADTAYINATAAGSYTSPSDNHVWTKSGTYIDNLTGAGCYKVAKVNLTINHIIYVNQNATGLRDGLTWSTAFANLRIALNHAAASDTIWVAAGTYQPINGASYNMKDSVKIYGGFAGTETNISQRNISANITILQGNNAVVIDNTTNNLTNAAVLDGFTITGGTNTSASGGGMANTNSSPTLSNLIFSNNTAQNGGGMNNNGSSPVLTNVLFINNTTGSSGDGGGMNNVTSSPTLTNVQFINDTAKSGSGGGICNSASSSSVLTDVVFSGNMASTGGALLLAGSSTATITNGVFYNNYATTGAAIDNTSGTTVTLTNLTFSNNTASFAGGGIDVGGTTNVTNSVFWGNTSSFGSADIGNGGGTIIVTYSYTQTNVLGTGNIKGSTDPFIGDANLAAAEGADGVWATTDDGLHLTSLSTAIGAGSNAAVPANITTDITGVAARIQGTAVDMGAYASGCKTTSSISVTACDSSTYTSYKGITYTVKTSGTYIDTLQNKALCDSLVRIAFTIHNSTKGDTTAVGCGGSFTWYGNTYITSGIDSITLTNKTGCDSIVRLHLTISPPASISDTTASACAQFKWRGKTYFESGTPIDTIKNILGCDSTYLTLNLTINPHTESAINIGTYAGTYKFKGTTETASGHYTFDTTSVTGCDSTVNLFLTLYAAPVISGNCAPDNLTLNGNPLPEFIQWQKGGVTIAADTAKRDTGVIVASRDLNGSYPVGLSFDAAGNMYVALGGNTEVMMYPKGFTATTKGTVVARAGITQMKAVRVDSKGNIFVEDYSLNKVLEYPVGSDSNTVPKTVASGFMYPYYLFVDNADNIYVSDDNSWVVDYFPAGDSNGVVVAQQGLSQPAGLYVDNSGNLFVSDYSNNVVIEFPPHSNSSTVGSIVAEDEMNNNAAQVWVDGNGYLYAEGFGNYGNKGTSTLYIYPPGSNATTHPIDSVNLSLVNGASDMAMNTNGNIFISDLNDNTVREYKNLIKLTDSVKTTGSYSAIVTSFSGSIDTVHVQVGASTTSNTNQTACDKYTSPSGKTWTSTGTFMDTIKNKSGCDSLMTINLTINTSPTITINGKDSITSGTVDTLVASGATTYSWTGGSTKDTLLVSPASTTTYTLTGTSNGCNSTVTFTVKVEILTGIQAITNGEDVNLYPNPADSYITINFSNKLSADAVINIVTESGQVLSTANAAISNGKTMPIDITTLANGVYFVKINTAGQTQVVRFVKSK